MSDETFEEHILQRVGRLEDGYQKMSATIIRLETVVEIFSKATEKFENTLEKTNKTLNDLNSTILIISNNVADNTSEISEMKGELVSANAKIKAVDEKSKIDFLKIVSDNLGKFLFGGGLLGIIVFWIDHMLDTYLTGK